jgi:isoleucyl-tRNA synthetase
VNVKEIDLIDDASDILVKQIKPNFKVLGPRFGKNMRAVGQAIQNFSQEDINIIEKEGKITLELDGNFVDLTLNEVEITSQDIEGWLVSNANGITVALDVSISPELKNEGIARELINRVQNLRKDSGLEVTDKISLSIQSQEELELAVKDNLDYIMNETLTAELNFDKQVPHGTEIEFDDIKSCVLIQKI